jgi:hypothetical protein
MEQTVKAFLILAVLALQGCAYMQVPNQSRYGYKSYDPCIRCGEKWNGYVPLRPLSTVAKEQRPLEKQ